MRDNLRLSFVARCLVLLGGTLFAGAFLYGVGNSMLNTSELFEVMVTHFAAVVGLPCAALAALGLVMFLEQTSGAIEFEGLGFKFKGASGPIVMWVISFMAMTTAIKILWEPS